MEYRLSYEELQKKIKEQQETIKNYESQFIRLREDFNYNVQLIYDRDKEIDSLNIRIDELIEVNKQKDLEIISLQNFSIRVRELEHEKMILSKRIESLLSYNNYPKAPPQKTNDPKSRAIRPNAINKYSTHSKRQSVDKTEENSEESSSNPLNKLNHDIECRIRSLENESDNKNLKRENRSVELSNSYADLSQTREIISNKEKEVSELIKSLSPYKKEFQYIRRHSPFENHSWAYQAHERNKVESSRPGSRMSAECIERELSKKKLYERPHSSFTKKINT